MIVMERLVGAYFNRTISFYLVCAEFERKTSIDIYSNFLQFCDKMWLRWNSHDSLKCLQIFLRNKYHKGEDLNLEQVRGDKKTRKKKTAEIFEKDVENVLVHIERSINSSLANINSKQLNKYLAIKRIMFKRFSL